MNLFVLLTIFSFTNECSAIDVYKTLYWSLPLNWSDELKYHVEVFFLLSFCTVWFFPIDFNRCTLDRCVEYAWNFTWELNQGLIFAFYQFIKITEEVEGKSAFEWNRLIWTNRIDGNIIIAILWVYFQLSLLSCRRSTYLLRFCPVNIIKCNNR